MRIKTTFLLLLTLTANFGWTRQRPHHYRPAHIECTVKEIERSKIHPQEAAAATGQANSSNWSGYVAAPNFQTSVENSVTYVGGDWTVPTLVATTDATYSAIWVGIDGYLNSTVEQIGTSQNWENGRQQNYAWFEMYPGGSYEISGFPVDAGDLISASVQYTGNNEFLMILSNRTKNITTTVPVSYTTSASAQRSSAEWIVEAPYSGSILSLSDFHIASLSNCSATISGVAGAVNNVVWKNDIITMKNGQTVKALPSNLKNSGSAFEVTWEHQ